MRWRKFPGVRPDRDEPATVECLRCGRCVCDPGQPRELPHVGEDDRARLARLGALLALAKGLTASAGAPS